MLAHAGIGSRRACEDLILQGRVTVNGQVVRELGTRVDPAHAVVAVDGQRIREERAVYFAVNKPKGYVSTNNDPAGKPKVVDLLPEIPQRVYTVGRLDEQSTGLMILTNDGELANKLAHPKFGVEKLYRVVVAGDPGRDVFQKLTEGVWLAEGKVRAKRVRPVARRGQATVLEMTLAEGKNREVRRMLAKLGHKVMSLTRIAVGPIGLKGLPVGGCRPLSAREVELLKKVAAGELLPFPDSPDRRPRVPRPASTSPSHPGPSAAAGPTRTGRTQEVGRPPLSGTQGQIPPRQRPPHPSAGGAGPRRSRFPDAGGPAQGPVAGGPGSRPPARRDQGGPRLVQRPIEGGPQGGPAGTYAPSGGGRRPAPVAGPGRPPAGAIGRAPAGGRPPYPGGPTGPRRPPQGGPRPPAGPSAAPPRPAPPLPGGPRRRIIGLDLGPATPPPGQDGPRRRPPVPRRAPRAAFGMKRKARPQADEGDSN